MNWKRTMQHWLMPGWKMKQTFSAQALQAIEAAIRESETSHYGELRFAIEVALDTSALLQGKTARERAIEVFSDLRVWDTERNNGVLIYLLLADRKVEIVADRGIHREVGQTGWDEACREMEQAFRQGRFEEGSLAGIRAVAGHLVKLYPASGSNENELPDQPIIL